MDYLRFWRIYKFRSTPVDPRADCKTFPSSTGPLRQGTTFFVVRGSLLRGPDNEPHRTALRHVEDRGVSKKKNRGWRGDVKRTHWKIVWGRISKTVKTRETEKTHEFPTDFLKIMTHLSVSLPSSIQLSMPIRSRLTLTTCSYRRIQSQFTMNTRSVECLDQRGKGRNGWGGSVDC